MAAPGNKMDLNDIDSWFDIKRYPHERSLTRRQWGQQIAKRAFYLKLVERWSAIPTEQVTKNWLGGLLSMQLDALFKEPLAEWMPNHGKPPVGELTVSEVLLLANLDGVNEEWSRPADDGVSVDSLIGLEGNFLGHLQINLIARDPEIIEAFKSWLKVRRSHFNYGLAQKAVRNQSDKEWMNSGLLPFADIKIWEAYTGQRLTQFKVVDTVFPDFQGDIRVKYQTALDTFKAYLSCENGLSLIYGNGDWPVAGCS